MKQSIILLGTVAFIAILTGCGGEAVNTDVATLQTQKDSLKTAIDELTTELLEIEKQLAEMDEDFSRLQVTAVEAKPSSFNHYFTVQGNIETDRNAQVFPESQGVVKSIRVSEGQKVAKGATLMTLDTELIRKNIAEVETQYDLAKDIYERQERLWEQNIGSEVQYLEAKTNKERLENTLATLNKQLSMGSVKAPFAGVVDQLIPKIGEMASPAMPVARVVSLDQMYVTSDVSEYYIGKVNEGMEIDVILPGIDTLEAAISRVGKYIKPENRTFEVAADLEDNGNLRPNMFCALRINDAHYDSAMVVPSSMVQQDVEGKEFLYVLKQKGDRYTVNKKFIESAESYEGQTRIASGIEMGDLIVDKGARRVIDGQEVDLFEEKKSVAQK